MVTPFRGPSMSEVDYESLDRLTNFLIDNGVNALMPLGTSGEFALLNRSEKEQVIERVVDRANGRVPVVAGVSEPATKNACDLARFAKEVGADAVISTGPFYYKTNDDGLLLHYQSLLDKTDLPLMIYNIPSYAGYNIQPEVVKKLSEQNPGLVRGVKFTTNDLSLFLDYLRLLGKEMQIMIGADSIFVSALDLGAAGGVLGSANVLPKETLSIYQNFAKGDAEEARRMQKKIDQFTSVMTLGTYPASLKYALRLLGMECGEVRPPLVPLNSEEEAKVRDSLSWKIKTQ